MEKTRVAEVLYAKIFATTEVVKWISMDGSGSASTTFKQLGGVDFTDEQANYASQAWRAKQVLGRPEAQPPEETAADRCSRLTRNLVHWCKRMGIKVPVGADASAGAEKAAAEKAAAEKVVAEEAAAEVRQEVQQHSLASAAGDADEEVTANALLTLAAMGQQAMVELGEDEVEVVEVAESTAVREVGFSAASTSLGQEGAGAHGGVADRCSGIDEPSNVRKRGREPDGKPTQPCAHQSSLPGQQRGAAEYTSPDHSSALSAQQQAQVAAALQQLAQAQQAQAQAQAPAQAAAQAQADVPVVGEAAAERGDEPACAICTDPLVGELWTCDECKQAVHRACLVDNLKAVRRWRCVCALPGLCSCRPAPTCPHCRAGLPPCLTRDRKCGTPGCTFRDGHGGLCSSVPPVSTDQHGRARRPK